MKRMKENYESRNKYFLTRRTPVIIRIDGKAFHTYTKGLDKPFDTGLIEDMQQTGIYLCQNIQGAKCAYVQSDEISILLTDYNNINTNSWFDYNISKLCSISASLATAKFNQLRRNRQYSINRKWVHKEVDNAIAGTGTNNLEYKSTTNMILALFDSRCFNIPKEEVCNYFIARQRDAVKNSISMLAQSMYSHKELHKKNQSDMQEMIYQKGLNWNDLSFEKKRGSFVVKNIYWEGELVKDTGGTLQSKSFYQQDYKPAIYSKVTTNAVTPTIRTKWEVVETPINFELKHFEKWL